MKMLPSTARLDAADFTRAYRQISVGPDVTLEDLLRPGFWVHHAEKIGVLDIIDVISTDGALDVQLRVTGRERGLLYLRPLRVYVEQGRVGEADAEVVAGEVPDGYVVDHTDKTSWRARTRNPSFIVATGLKTKSAAIAAAVDHATKANGGTLPQAADPATTPIPDDWEALHHIAIINLAASLTGGEVVAAEGKSKTETARDIIRAVVEERASVIAA